MPCDNQVTPDGRIFSRRALLVAAVGVLLSLGCRKAPPDPDKPIPPPPDMSELRGGTAPAPPDQSSP